ncbi:hypothetical protein H0H92_013889, partial [Tricholoma furcatifolium]
STAGAPVSQRRETRRTLNPLKNISIPPPPTSIPQTLAPINPAAKRTPHTKQLVAKIGVTTARNLYLIDYLVLHPEATEGEFSTVWKACDAVTKEKYETLSKEHAKARKKGAAPTMAPILTTTSSNVPDAPDVN